MSSSPPPSTVPPPPPITQISTISDIISITTTTLPQDTTTTTTQDIITTTTTPQDIITTTTTTPNIITTTIITEKGGNPTPTTTTTKIYPPATPKPDPPTSTLIFTTLVLSTNVNGQVVTKTVQSTQIVSLTATPSPGGSNIGAIAGGAVGGAISILAFIVIVFLCLRRHRRHKRTDDDKFEENFDPDSFEPQEFGGSATRLDAIPNIDLVGVEVTPFQYNPEATQQKGYRQYPQMAQRPGMQTPLISGGGSGHDMSDVHSSTTGSHYPKTVTDQSVTGMQNADWRNPSPGPSLVTSSTFPSSKGRESAGKRRRPYVANDERGEGGSGQGDGPVVQLKDAGPVQQQNAPAPEEVPPSYDSISPGDRPAAGRS